MTKASPGTTVGLQLTDSAEVVGIFLESAGLAWRAVTVVPPPLPGPLGDFVLQQQLSTGATDYVVLLVWSVAGPGDSEGS